MDEAILRTGDQWFMQCLIDWLRATGLTEEFVAKLDGTIDTCTDEDTLNAAAGTQRAKADKGKLQLTLVPRRIIWDIAVIREYGCRKYGDSDNWKRVEPQRYRDAAMRHMMRYLDDPEGNDDESGLPHLWHLACNIAFLCEMEGEQHDNTGNLRG